MGLWEGEYISTQSRYQTQGERVLNNYWERFLHRNERVNMHVMTLRRLRENNMSTRQQLSRFIHCMQPDTSIVSIVLTWLPPELSAYLTFTAFKVNPTTTTNGQIHRELDKIYAPWGISRGTERVPMKNGSRLRVWLIFLGKLTQI